ncbi:MAG: hypothetical protein CME33_07915 [Gimesia sp.]|nr:hypothetical protein [Gimesia sp.]
MILFSISLIETESIFCADNKDETSSQELRKQAESFEQNGDHEQAIKVREQILLDSENNYGMKHLDIVPDLQKLADLYYQENHFSKADILLQRILR